MKIQLRNPDPIKKGAMIDEEKYEVVKQAIVESSTSGRRLFLKS